MVPVASVQSPYQKIEVRGSLQGNLGSPTWRSMDGCKWSWVTAVISIEPIVMVNGQGSDNSTFH